MKKILIILTLFLICNNKSLAQNDLYLIFDINTPPITKDIGKYIGWNEVIMKELTVYKSTHTAYLYFYDYPLFARHPLTLEKKEGTTVQTIPMSAVSSYPAKTITELDAEMQPLIEADFNDPLTDSWGRGEIRTINYFADFDKFYVIELDPANNQAYIVEVKIIVNR